MSALNRNWFNCVVKSQKPAEDGSTSKETEQYLVDAVSYTEAETRINHIVSQMGASTFMVDKITKTNYVEVVNMDDSDKWFRTKVSLVAYDEETEKEKQTHQYFLVAGEDIEDVYTKTKQIMRGSIAGYVIPSISYTKILDVFPYLEEERIEREMAEKGFRPLTGFETPAEELAPVAEEVYPDEEEMATDELESSNFSQESEAIEED